MGGLLWQLYSAARWLFELPLPACAGLGLSPLFLWWLWMLWKNRRDKATFRQIAYGGGALLASLVVAMVAGGMVLRWLATP